MNIAVIIIAIGTFIGLAFMPLLLTRRESSFWRINRIGAWCMAILVLPSLYWDTGQVGLGLAWCCFFVLSFLSRYEPRPRTRQMEVVWDQSDGPRISATEKIQHLERLAKMRASGLLSNEEFNSEKKNYMG